MENLIRNAIKMIRTGELVIKYINLDPTFTGSIMKNNEQITILLNNNLSYEYNIRKLLHELEHIKHLGTNKECEKCEEEAEKAEINPVDIKQLVNFINN